MKKKSKTPTVRVSNEEYEKLRDTETKVFKTPLSKRLLKFLPRAYESISGTMLVFPKNRCPKHIRFKPSWKFWAKPVTRELVNVMAIKEEDMSETLRFLLK